MADKKKAKKKQGKRVDKTRSKPLSLEALKEYGALEGFAAPAGEFDPAGSWKHLYRLWLVAPSWHQYRGFFELSRTAGEGSIGLAMNRSILLSQHPAFHDTTIQLTCSPDVLCTPRSWELNAVTRDIQSKPIEVSRVEEKASVDGGTIGIERNGRTLKRTVPTPFTTDVSLLEAVGRLPGAATKPLEFALLQDMDELKPGHKLSYREEKTFEVNGASLKLRCYQELGQGILPYLYYVDEHGRLLFAISAVRSYIYDPNAREERDKKVAWLIEKQKRSKK